MNSTMLHVTASINGGEPADADLTLDQPHEWIVSKTAVKPDPAWTHSDALGHYHAYDDAGELPHAARRVRPAAVRRILRWRLPRRGLLAYGVPLSGMRGGRRAPHGPRLRGAHYGYRRPDGAQMVGQGQDYRPTCRHGWP